MFKEFLFVRIMLHALGVPNTPAVWHNMVNPRTSRTRPYRPDDQNVGDLATAPAAADEASSHPSTEKLRKKNEALSAQ